MKEEESFVAVAGLICEPVRAKMLWRLLEKRAYTAGELAVTADIFASSASNHLTKLLTANILKVQTQGWHRYYFLANNEVAYVIEALANLVKSDCLAGTEKKLNGVKYCRSCYEHLAGFVGVRLVEEFEQKGYLKKSKMNYEVTNKGWKWFSSFDISKEDFKSNRRLLTRQCLDWSERRPNLAGQLGAALLEKMLERGWSKRVQFSRELIVTSKGKKELYELTGLSI